jgi:hypothetical protein
MFPKEDLDVSYFKFPSEHYTRVGCLLFVSFIYMICLLCLQVTTRVIFLTYPIIIKLHTSNTTFYEMII